MKSILLVLTLVFAHAAYAQAASLCEQDEQVVFSCSTGKKVVSLCASKEASKSSGYLQYRFGAQNRIELIFPNTPKHPKGQFEATRLTPMMDNGTRAQLYSVGFAVNKFNYAIESTSVGESTSATLNVLKDGKSLAQLTCLDSTIQHSDFRFFDVLESFGLTD